MNHALKDDVLFDDLDELNFDNLDNEDSEVTEDIVGEIEDIEFDEEIFSEDEGSDTGYEYADNDGTIIDSNTLLSDDTISNDASFISDSGDIVVMDNTDTSQSFDLVYVDIENIAIVHRIRKNNNVVDLVKSIKSTGLLNPVVVAPTATEGIYVLLDGYRRVLACAKAGKRKIPCIVNNKVSTPEIPVLEALYNHHKKYTIKEIVDYIDYLEKQKGIMSASMIEYLLQLNSGDYTKLKDILNDNDEDIVSKLYEGIYTIDQAFKKLEQRRKKESAEEKELKKIEKVYENTEESGIDNIAGSGEEAGDGPGLTDEEIKSLAINASELDDGLEDASLDEMVEEGKKTPGFEPHKQSVDDREYIDPAIRKAVLARDNFTCACCKRGGESYVDALDYHHIMPVFLGGEDTPENGITLCLTCHRMVHLYSVGDLHLPKEKSQEELDKMTEEERIIYKDEQMRLKRIVRLGQIIRDAIAMRGMKREEFKKKHPVGNIGRNKPGRIQEQG